MTTSPLAAYVPQDRLRALASAADLPSACHGAALFSDISGFTALTEALTRAIGQRRGVDELTRRINTAHQALIEAVEQWGGSVLSLAGDGMTCWFDAGPQAPRDATRRAIACGAAMQVAMARLDDLAVKVGIAAGPALRLAVGDPAIQRIDLLAGATVAQAVRAQDLAAAGEVVVDAAAARALAPAALGSQRGVGAGPFFYSVSGPATPSPTPSVAASDTVAAVDTEALRPWVLPAVYLRETTSGGLFKVDLRPATAVFVHLALGVAAPPGDEGDALASAVACVQRTLWQHGGVLLEVSVDATGTCCYGNFGAAQVHEDDAQRALRAALQLRQQLAEAGIDAGLGLASGTLCVGGYGSNSRRSFGAIGDAVNAAARLMALAHPGEVLVAGRVRQPLADDAFTFEPRPPIALKGKAEPLPVFVVTGLQQRRSIRLQEPTTALPIVGRAAEAALLAAAIEQACAGRGQVLNIVAEAGMGKSRLLLEAVRMARRRGLIGYGGSCPPGGALALYGVWQGVWTAWFDLDPTLPARRQRQAPQAALALHAPEHAQAWPLLGAVLGQDWSDTALTAALQPKDRKSLLHAVLQRCWQAAAAEAAEDGRALLVVLEDLHTADALSLELLADLTRGIESLPVLVLASERRAPGDADTLAGWPQARRIELRSLELADVEHIVRAKLALRFPERQGPLPHELLQHIAARAQGNPFYVEELLDYLHDRGLDPGQPGAVAALELPASLHRLVLSRIDALGTVHQNELKAASVMGREFSAADLQGYCPSLGTADLVLADLTELGRQGFTPRLPDPPEPRHVFRHAVTQEVAYESIGLDTRAQLHGQYAHFVQAQSPEAGAQAALLAHHFVQAERALGREEACRYLQLAGEQAAERFANEEALVYFEQALQWLPVADAPARFALLVQRLALLNLLARREQQMQDLDTLAQLAQALPDVAARSAEVAILRAKLDIELGRYASARTHAQAARALVDGDAARLWPGLYVNASLQLAQAMLRSGEAAASRPLLDAALLMARAHGLANEQSAVLSGIGHLHWQLGDFVSCEHWFSEALHMARESGPWRAQINLLNNLGAVAQLRGRLAEAALHYGQALQIARRLGDLSGQAMLLNNLGSAGLVSGHYYQALQYAEQAAALFAQTGETMSHAQALATAAEAHRELGQLPQALGMSEHALTLLREGGSRPSEALVLENLGLIEAACGQREAGMVRLQQAAEMARGIGSLDREASARVHLGQLQAVTGDLAKARTTLQQAEQLVASLDSPTLALELDAAQAQLLAACHEPAAAAARLERLAQHLLSEPEPDAPCLPIGLYATAWLVLDAAADPRAAALRLCCQRELLARADRIPDLDIRRGFLATDEHQSIPKGQPDAH